MNYSEFNLGQLLELALRVPEVGAVNFNILYYILKTIIEKEGLAELKPIVNLDSFLTDPESSLKGSFSDKDIVGAKDKLKERYDEYDEKSRNTKGSLKWKNIQLFKRLDSIEEEIDTIHQGLSQLFNEMSNLERVSRHQAEKVVKVISEVPQLMEMRKEISELKLKYEEIADSSFFEEKSDKTSEVPLSETRISENKLDMEKVKENILTESKTKEDLRSKISDLTCESEIPEEVVKHKVTEKEVRKPSHRKSKEQEILSKIELLNEEVISIKEMMKFGLLSHTAARTDDQEKDETVMEERVIDLEDIPSKQGKIIKKMDLHLLDVSTELHKLMDKCDVLDRTFSQEIGQIKESTLILELGRSIPTPKESKEPLTMPVIQNTPLLNMLKK